MRKTTKKRKITAVLVVWLITLVVIIVKVSSLFYHSVNKFASVTDVSHVNAYDITAESTIAVIESSDADSVPEVTAAPEPETIQPIYPDAVYMQMSEEDIWELATLVFLESGGESYECQKAVASVVINRMVTDDASLQEVIYAKNQFSPAKLISCSEPSESTLKAVREVITDGPSIPIYVTYFRASYYHNWSDAIIPYAQYDNTYFSYDIELYNKYCND